MNFANQRGQATSTSQRPFASCGNLCDLSSESENKRQPKISNKGELNQNWTLIDAVEERAPTVPVRLPMSSFNHIAREVLSLEKSKQFYVDILGFEVIPRPPFDCKGYWLYGYGLSLHLVATTVPQARKKIKYTRIQHFSSALPRVDHIAFLSNDLSVIRETLDREKVYYKTADPKNSGISQIFFFDPDGNVIEISNCAPKIGETRCTVEDISDMSESEPLSESEHSVRTPTQEEEVETTFISSDAYDHNENQLQQHQGYNLDQHNEEDENDHHTNTTSGSEDSDSGRFDSSTSSHNHVN